MVVVCIFFDYVEGEVEIKHDCYVYSLGVCEVSRRRVKCLHLDTREEKAEKSTIGSWWSKATNKTKWPDKPKLLVFKRIHKFSKSQSWCTYVLQHEGSVAASSLCKEDLLRFGHRDVSNNAMFVGCLLDPVNESKMYTVERSIEEHITLYARVVPYQKIQQKCEEVEKGLLEDKKSQDLCKRLVVQLDDSTEPQEIKRQFLKIMEQTLHRTNYHPRAFKIVSMGA